MKAEAHCTDGASHSCSWLGVSASAEGCVATASNSLGLIAAPQGLMLLAAGRIQYSLWVVQPGLGQRQYILQVGGRRDMVAVQMRVLCIAKQLAKHTSIKNVIDPAATNVKASSSAVVPHCIRQVILSNGELTDETNRGRITQPLLSKGTLPKSKRKTAPTTSQSPLPI
eukprot:CAMPEP_0172685340 /NCGR_PEP_ID=MMETSP1074-20121228/20172_1 /TAXON_ID=2916 /ORGANISM="Ceratium fusus, Strain PA161109" /LENGTH=168 /DNA_ID=CAMNT_0013504465 /DNA_START=78 /DNA_END=585 /DNA_ORIENTATION=-